MEYNEEHIRLMMIERLAGTIAAPEDEALEALIRSDATIRRQWQALQGTFDTPAARMALDSLPERQQRVWEHIEEQRDVMVERRFKVGRAARIVRLSLAAVILTAIAAGTIYFLQRPKDQPLKTMRMPGSEKVQLRLADGQTINISGAGRTISLGAGQ